MKKIILAIFLILCFWSNAFAIDTYFYLTSNTNWGYVYGSSSSNPPPYSGYDNGSATYTTVGRYQFNIDNAYRLYIPLFRFDTSSIPDAATISDASLSFYTTINYNTTGKTLNCEFYSGSWTWGSGMYTTSDIGTTAFQEPLSNFYANQTKEVFLSTLSNISKTGYTSFRAGVPGAYDLADAKQANFSNIVLKVTYTAGYSHEINGVLNSPEINGVANPTEVNGL